MADGSSSPTNDLFFFLALLGGLFVLWLATGGPDRSGETSVFGSINTRNEYREQGTAGRTGGAQAEEDVEEELARVHRELERVQEEVRQARIRGEASPYEGMVEIRGGRPQARLMIDEYIELVADRSNDIDISITGWVLESVITGQRIPIPGASRLPFPGEINQEQAIIINPGDRVYINSGRSPIGVGFRVNTCSGYFEQFQNFTPRLRLQCPDPEEEFEKFANVPVTHLRIEEDERYICQQFIDRNVDRCEINRIDLEEVEPNLSNACIDFIEEAYTYKGCVSRHQFDVGFYTGEWYAFIKKPFELWREEYEIIRLLDEQGRTVDVFDY